MVRVRNGEIVSNYTKLKRAIQRKLGHSYAIVYMEPDSEDVRKHFRRLFCLVCSTTTGGRCRSRGQEHRKGNRLPRGGLLEPTVFVAAGFPYSWIYILSPLCTICNISFFLACVTLSTVTTGVFHRCCCRCCCFSHPAYWLPTRKTTLHGGQSRSWSAEQGKENRRRTLAAYPPPPPQTQTHTARSEKNKK